jgi:hypothetical protein
MRLPENVWSSRALRRRLEQEARFESNQGKAQKKHYWFTVPEGDTLRGDIALRNFTPGPFDIEPHPAQIEMARHLRGELQRGYHFDGVWIVGWTHPPATWDVIHVDGDNVWSRLVMIWLDGDADPQYTVESDMPIPVMIENGPEYYIGLCLQAHAAYTEAYSAEALKEDMGIKDAQTSKEVLSTIN